MPMSQDDGTQTFQLVPSGIFLPASVFLASAAGPALVISDAIHQAWALDGAGAFESVSTGFVCPPYWDYVDMFFYGYNTAGGAGGVSIGYYIEDLIQAQNMTVETPVPAAFTTFAALAQDLMSVVVGPTKVGTTRGAFHSLKIGRDSAQAGDTLANDWGFLGVLLKKAA
jgi:hypothetical protein